MCTLKMIEISWALSRRNWRQKEEKSRVGGMSWEKYQVIATLCTLLVYVVTNGTVGLEFSSDAEQKHDAYLKERTQLLKQYKVYILKTVHWPIVFSIIPYSHPSRLVTRVYISQQVLVLSLITLLLLLFSSFAPFPIHSWIYTNFCPPMPHWQSITVSSRGSSLKPRH